MPRQQDFRRYAEECERLAEDGDVAAHRDALDSMATTWLKLAAEEERIAELVHELDNLFSAAGRLDERPAWSGVRNVVALPLTSSGLAARLL